MRTPAKLLLLAATVLPLLYGFGFMAFFIFMFVSAFNGHPPPFLHKPPAGTQNRPPTWFLELFGVHLLMMFWIIGLMILYFRNLFRNPRLTDERRILWGMVLFFGNVIAMPFYWYVYIWKEPPPTAAM
ncbi:MAG: hypothetical protein ACYDCL_23110 [Myxococcales bacterium]